MKNIETKEKKTPFYKKAILPWIIIIFVITAFAFTVFGWTMRSADYGRTSSEANAIVKQSLKASK